VQLDPRDVEPARLVAPDLEPGPVEDQRIEPRRCDQGGSPGERRLDGGQAERRAAVVIEDGHVGEKELGAQPSPIRFDGADRDALAQRLRYGLFDVTPVLRDFREDPVAQGKQRSGKQEIQSQQRPAEDARGDAPAAFRRNRLGQRFLDRLLELL